MQARWDNIVSAVAQKSLPVSAFLKEGSVGDVAGNVISVGFSARHSFHRESLSAPERLNLVMEIASAILGQSVRVKLVARRGESVRVRERPEVEDPGSVVQKSEGVRKLVERSGGRIVHIDKPEN